MLDQIRAWGEKILLKIKGLAPEVQGYIKAAISAANMLIAYSKDKTVLVTIKALFPNLTDEELAKVEAGIVAGIKYLTQSQAVLAAGTPDQMLQAFLADMQADTAGAQQTKIVKLIQKVVAALDNNKWLQPVYDYLVQKYFTAQAVDKIAS